MVFAAKRVSLVLGSSALALALSVQAQAQTTDEQQAQDQAECAAIADPTKRQACIDALPQENEEALPASGDIATLPLEQQRTEAIAGGAEIVVTGSRIARSVFDSPDPISIINPDLQLKQGSIDTAEIIQTTPVALGSTQITSFLSSNFVTNGGPGAQTISLRGLGAERTLVLLNGRRAGPAGTRGAVASFDLNVLPSSIVQSVEILKTGASSVYGSDAVAGVVNVITKRDTDGIEMRGFASVPEESGGETYDLSATYGKVFDRGHILVSASYYRREELARRDRDYLDCQEDYVFTPEGERADIRDPRTGEFKCNGIFGPVIALADFQETIAGAFGIPISPYDPDGDGIDDGFMTNLVTPGGQSITAIQYNNPGDMLDQYLPGLIPPSGPYGVLQFSAPTNLFPINFDGPSTGLTNLYPRSEQNDSVIPRMERKTLYLDGSYELTSSIELFGEFLYNNRKTRVNATRQVFPQQFTGSSFLPQFFCSSEYCDPADSGDPFNSEFGGEAVLIPIMITDHFDSSTDVDYYRGVVGAQGDFGSGLPGWTWNGYVQYSRSDGDYTQDIIFQDAFDAFNLRTRSCEGMTTSIRGAPCVDLDFTDPRVLNADLTPEERAFLYGVDTGNTVYTQWNAELSAAGDLFELPAGTVKAAVGVTWRRDEINDVPGEATQAGNSWGLTSAGITAGHAITKEAFGELEIPLIYNTPFIQDLTFSGAARVTNVTAERSSDGLKDSSKGNWTYKLGLNWQVTDWLRFRGTYGTSYRAPALFEQFLADQTSFSDQIGIDPCINWGTRLEQGVISQRFADNCASVGVPDDYSGGGTSSALIISGGGIGVLEPETSTAKTASVILTPSGGLWEGMRFSLAVDYFDIKVKGEIAQLGAAAIVAGCYGSDFFPDEPLCGQFTRVDDPGDPRDNQITEVNDSFLNINSQRNRGFDLTARVIQDLGDMGTVSLQAQMTWQSEDTIALFEGTLIDNNGESGEPIWVGDFVLNWEREPWTFVYGLDVVGGTSNMEDLIEDRGEACFNNAFRGMVCPDVRLSPTFYHDASITVDVNEDYEFTIGVSNLFDTPPPRASTAFTTVSAVGQTPVLGSQYDLLGRRFFVAATSRF